MFYAGSFLLLTAPPAWGKTRLFRQWVTEYARPFLYVSPLRALANEVMAALADHRGLHVLESGRDRKTWEAWARAADHARILVVTPEQLGDFSWEALARYVPDAVIVWDEIHLVRMWGESFRESLLQQWWGFCASGLCGVGLTATADAVFWAFLRESLAGHPWQLLHGDAGNFEFKTKPVETRYFPAALLTILVAEQVQRNEENLLVFCAHRSGVDEWVAQCHEWGVSALGCKGGETSAFQQRLAKTAGPLSIFSTSCLSHGVNLPSLKTVVILYDEPDASLVHQMSTRGGRRGEVYRVWRVGNLRQWLKLQLIATLWRVAVAQVTLFMGEWWHDAGRPRHPSHSPERA